MVALVDFEHAQSRATSDTKWEQLIDGFGLTDQERARYTAARRLLCFFWPAR